MSGKIKQIGDRFGDLEIIEFGESLPRGLRMIKFKCHGCNKDHWYKSNSKYIRSDYICDHEKEKPILPEKKPGARFGTLEILDNGTRHQDGKLYYRCFCNGCGSDQIYVRSDNLKITYKCEHGMYRRTTPKLDKYKYKMVSSPIQFGDEEVKAPYRVQIKSENIDNQPKYTTSDFIKIRKEE